MIEFRRNEETGILEAWKDGKYVGNIITMGDEIEKPSTEIPDTSQQRLSSS